MPGSAWTYTIGRGDSVDDTIANFPTSVIAVERMDAPTRESPFAGRPVWANLLLAFTAFMTFVYTPWDMLMKPVAQDQEVWFGLMFTGWWAKATEPLHLALYAAFTWGLWKMRPWMRFWGTAWIVQIAIGMLVWNLTDERGSVLGGVVTGIVFAWLARAYWRAGRVFVA